MPQMLEVTDEDVWTIKLVDRGTVPHPDSGTRAEDPAAITSSGSETGSGMQDLGWAEALGKALKEAFQPAHETPLNPF